MGVKAGVRNKHGKNSLSYLVETKFSEFSKANSKDVPEAKE